MFGNKELLQVYIQEIMFNVYTDTTKAHGQLFKLKQNINKYTRETQQFIITNLCKVYIEKKMYSAATEELDNLKNIIDDFWESDKELIETLERRIKEII